MPSGTEAPIKAFASATEWEQWLAEHHQTEPRLWLQIAKKTSGISTVTYDEALDVALCHGWIDGQRKSYDGDYFLQKFSPRRPGSLWSKRNVAKVSKLTEASRMRHAGFVEVDAAQQDGRWQAAYDSQRTMAIPEDFMSALERNETAKASFGTLSKSSLYAIGWRLQTARTPETRARRLSALIRMLESGQAP